MIPSSERDAPESMALPRLLLLTNEFPQTIGAGSILLYRLFQDYPSDRLLVVSNSRASAGAELLRCRHEWLPLAADRLIQTRFWPWRAALRALGASRLPSIRRIDRVVAGFAADLVVVVMQDTWFYDLGARYAAARGRPLVVVVTDLPQAFEPVPPWLRRLQHRRDATVLQRAVCRLAVSRGMVEFFGREFGLSGELLPLPRADRPVAQDPERCRALKVPGRLTLGFAGGLHYGYGEQFLRMLPQLRQAGTIVECFGPHPGGRLTLLKDATDVFHFNGYLTPPERAWEELLRRCDVVLQPYLNPPGPHGLQYRTHFPSKLGDCLALGLPLLITGPAEASGVRWCLEHSGSAVVLTDSSPAALAEILSRLRDDADLRVSVARAAQAAGVVFAAAPLRTQFYRRLASLAATAAP